MHDAVCLGCGARVSDASPCACMRVAASSAPSSAAPQANPYRDAAEGPALGRCPRCRDVLIDEEYAGTPLDECAACGGVFVEGWVLDRLVEARDARVSLTISLPVRPIPREREVRYLRCPQCAVQMNRKIYGRSSGVVVDVCKRHGVWFDAGELAAVLEFVEGGGLERARKREEDERREQERGERIRAQTAPHPVAKMLNAPVRGRSQLATELFDTILDWWIR